MRYWAASDVGLRREHNEDTFRTSDAATNSSLASTRGVLTSDSAWILVADGMGGHAGGEVASLLAVECLSSSIPMMKSVSNIAQLIEATNLAIFEAMELEPDLAGMGTTIAGILIQQDKFYIFNVGDSRIYLQEDLQLHQVSEDHVVDGCELTKCIGGASNAMRVRPYVKQLPLPRRARLLACTDGLTDLVSDAEINELMQQSSPADCLIQAALSKGGLDNVTAVVLELP